MPGDATTAVAGQLALHGWAMATAAVVAASCAVVGTLLVARRMSLIGDAIGHGVLPGIALAVLAGGAPGGPLTFLGAVAAALLTVWLTQGLRDVGGLTEDAGAGVAFTTLFAVGVLIVSAAGPGSHIDPACVLAGDLAFVPFDTMPVGAVEVPRAFLAATVVLAAVLVAAAATWKLQVATAFDAAAARAAGLPVTAVTTGLLGATAVVTVASFDAVGAVLVVALLVAPAAAAELLTRRLHAMAAVAVSLAVAAACSGYLVAWRSGTNAAGMIAVVLGLEYLLAALLAPEEGVVAQALARLRLAWRVAAEDRIAALWRAEEAGDAAGSAVRGRGRAREWMLQSLVGWWLRFDGTLEPRASGWRLSARGRREAEMVVRSHRLWEAWLGRNAEIPVDHLHPPAEWVEHHLGAAMRRRLEAETGWRDSDPHGRDIPPEA